MISKKKLLILTQWFDPEPVHKGLIFAKKLKDKGFDIEIITGFPNYPTGKIYDGYKLKLFQREYIDNIKINRVFLYPSHDNSAFKRALNYISFNIFASLYGILFVNRPEIIYAYHPPITVGVSAILLKLFFKVPLVYDVQDLWPDTLQATGIIKSKIIFNIISIICKTVYKFSNKIVVLSPGFKAALIKRGVESKKIHIIYNWSNLKRKNDFEKNIYDKDKFNIIFAGNIGKAQSLDTLTKSAELLLKKDSKANFIIIGDGLELKNLKSLASRKNLTNIEFISRVSSIEIGRFLENADALIVHLKKDKLFKITIPSKTQTYMAYGKPLIMAVEGDAANLIKEAKCGFVCKSENYKQIANCIDKLINLDKKDLTKLGENGIKYYDANLSLDSGIKKFTDIFNSLLK